MDGLKMVDLQGQYLKIKNDINEAIQSVIDSGAFINGEPVKVFASELAEYLGSDYVIPCGNGTDALQIAYQTVGLEPGDEVIMPAFNYVASAEAAALLKLVPRFADVEPDTFNIDPVSVERQITPKTKAIVVVHLFGQSANMEAILQIAKANHLTVIEDNAQSLGSDFRFSRGDTYLTGSMGDISTYSFFPTKNLGCFGDGGAISTNRDDYAERARKISMHGQGSKYNYELVGCNSRLDTLQAAILSVKLKKINYYLESRVEAGSRYLNLLKSCDQIVLPQLAAYSQHTFNQFVIRIANRDKVKEELREAGIPTMIYYPSPLHLQNAYAYLGYKKGDFPVAEKMCTQVLALPIHTEITEKQQEFIVDKLIKIVTA